VITYLEANLGKKSLKTYYQGYLSLSLTITSYNKYKQLIIYYKNNIKHFMFII
jgi:hypothetical protein